MFDWFEKSGADRGLHISEGALLVFAALVAIGLIGEYKKEKDERWKGISDVFELLVIIGVVGELIFDGLIFGFSGRLTVLQDMEVAAAISAASEATEQAGAANERAAVANQLAEEARERAAKLEPRVGKVEGGLESVGSIAGTTAKTLDERTLGRSITEAQATALRYAIRGQARAIFVVRLNDSEPLEYSQDIFEALKKARFKPQLEVLRDKPEEKGVVFCENSKGDKTLRIVLEKLKIVTKYVAFGARNRPSFCGGTNVGNFAPMLNDTGNAARPAATGVIARIFVGERAAIR